MSTKISWTDETWNPIIGCEPISPGCKNCYAEKMAYRLAHIEKTDYYQNVIVSKVWNGKTHFVESQLNKPLKWKKPRMIFVCSMGDLFHESVPFEWVMKVYDIIAQSPQHTFQILTKRPERMKQFFEYLGVGFKNAGFDSDPTDSENLLDYFEPLDNILPGVTAENQEQANKRIPILLQIPAKVRGVSVEPMLGPVSLHDIECRNSEGKCISYYQVLKPITGCGDSDRPALDWVICGGESGHNARPINPDWVRSLKNQCEAANVPFFFKQWNKKSQGSELDGKEYKQFPKK